MIAVLRHLRYVGPRHIGPYVETPPAGRCRRLRALADVLVPVPDRTPIDMPRCPGSGREVRPLFGGHDRCPRCDYPVDLIVSLDGGPGAVVPDHDRQDLRP